MAKIKQNFTMYQGDVKTIVFTVSDQDSAANPKPAKDITSIDLRWSLVKLKDDGTYSAAPLFDKESNVGTEITKPDPVNGVAHVLFEEADTLTLKPGDYYHQLEGQTAGAPLILADGVITILKKVVEDLD